MVLWAERLPPAKACLLLSLVARAGRYPRAEQHLRLLAEDRWGDGGAADAA